MDKFSSWIQNSPVCTKIIDLDFNLQFMSASGARELKIDDITEFYGKPYPLSFYPDSFKTPMTNNLKKAKETGKTVVQEASVLDTEGNELWYHSTIIPVNDDNGRLDYLMVVSVETTKRKQAEEALQDSEKKFHDLYNNAPDMYISVDPNTAEILQCNQTSVNNLGYTRDEIIGRPIFEMYHPDCIDDVKKTFQLFVETGEINNAELKLKRKDGGIIDVSLNVSAVRDKKGKILFSRSAWHDITERKKLGEKAARFSRIFEDSLNEIFLFDVNTLKFIQTNSAAQNNLGYSVEEINTMTPLDFKPEFTAESFAKLVDPLRKGEKEKIVFETVHQRKDQSLYNVEVHLQLIQFEKGSVFAAIILDITDRKKTENELKEHREHLKELVKERTQKLEEQNKELERFNSLFVNREFRIKELRDRVKELEEKIPDISEKSG